jgi:LPS O-antigen subunit length determinant protein (WzzB/FepE family)
MQVKELFVQKRTIIVEVAVLLLVLIGGYYLYSSFSTDTATVSQPQVNQALLGKNLVLFYKLVNQDKVSFKDISALDSALAQRLQDFTEIIQNTNARGRPNPFTPITTYASSRSIR